MGVLLGLFLQVPAVDATASDPSWSLQTAKVQKPRGTRQTLA